MLCSFINALPSCYVFGFYLLIIPFGSVSELLPQLPLSVIMKCTLMMTWLDVTDIACFNSMTAMLHCFAFVCCLGRITCHIPLLGSSYNHFDIFYIISENWGKKKWILQTMGKCSAVIQKEYNYYFFHFVFCLHCWFNFPLNEHLMLKMVLRRYFSRSFLSLDLTVLHAFILH